MATGNQASQKLHHDVIMRVKRPISLSEILINQPVNPYLFLPLFHCIFPNTEEFNTPGYIENSIVIQTSGQALFKQWEGNPSSTHTALAEDLGIVPSYASINWLMTGDFTILHLYLHPTLLASVALKALDTDPAKIELRYRATFRDPLLYSIGTTIRAESESGGKEGRLYADTLTQFLAIHLLRKYAVFPQSPFHRKGGLTKLEINRVIDYINDHLGDDLLLADLARVANVSEYHLAHLFKRATGQSLHQYVITRRVTVALGLIQAGRLPLAAIAYQVGFADQSHLNRNFKRLLGISPGALLRECKNIQ